MQITKNSRGHKFQRGMHGCYPVNNGDPQCDYDEEEDGEDHYADYCDKKAEENAN